MNNIITPKVGLSGQYRIEIKRNNQLIKETDWFDNLITNSGLNYLYGSAPTTHCCVGTGTSIPVPTNTSLDVKIGNSVESSGATAPNPVAPNYIKNVTKSYTFAQGAIVGNITEVGIGPQTGDLFSRALITDINGNPVTLSLLAIDQLTIYYKLTYSPILTDAIGSVTIAGVTYSTMIRQVALGSFMDSYNETIFDTGSSYINSHLLDATTPQPTITSNSGNQTSSTISGVVDPYINNSYIKNIKYTYPISYGNFPTGIKYAWNSKFSTNNTQFVTTFTPEIPKTNTQVLTLTFAGSWGRA